ncbi:MAG: hypothetical protein ACRDTA_25070 [Pseudonocardiaceae bacterium]
MSRSITRFSWAISAASAYPDSLLPIHERLEQPGSTYALHHTSVHTVQAEADTISLLVSG